MAEAPMTFAQVVAAIAQGAINIDNGLTTIETGSRVHRGMHELCRLLSDGLVTPADLESQKWTA